MPVNPIPHYDGPEGQQKLPICKKCHDKVAVVFCDKCGCPLCMDCRHTHACNKKEDKKLPN